MNAKYMQQKKGIAYIVHNSTENSRLPFVFSCTVHVWPFADCLFYFWPDGRSMEDEIFISSWDYVDFVADMAYSEVWTLGKNVFLVSHRHSTTNSK